MTWASEPAFKAMEAADAVRPRFSTTLSTQPVIAIIRCVTLKTCLKTSWTLCSTSKCCRVPSSRCQRVDYSSNRYEDDRRTLKSLVKAAGISVKPDWDIDRFKKMLAKTDGADSVMAKTQNVDMFFTELLERCAFSQERNQMLFSSLTLGIFRAHEDSKRNLKKLERRLYDHLRRQTRHKLLSPDLPFEAVAAATAEHETWKRLSEEGNDPTAVKRIVERWVQHEAKRQVSGAGDDSGSSRSRSASRDRRGKADDRTAPRDRSRDRDEKGGSTRDSRGGDRRERSREARDRYVLAAWCYFW